MYSTVKTMNKKNCLHFICNLIMFGFLSSAIPAHAFHFPWDQGHDTTEPNDPEDPGPCEGPDCENDPCNASSQGSPVYIATGHLIWSEADIVLQGRPNLSVTRTFNSHDPRVGLLGNGWSMSCDQGLIYTVRHQSNGQFIVPVYEYVRRLPNGKRYAYTDQGDGTFVAPGLFNVVTRQSDNRARLQRRDGSYSIYSERGLLDMDVDRNGNAINYTYDPQGRLTQKADTNGRAINYEYNINGLIAIIRDHTGREWQYSYDENANLISVTDPLNGVRQYVYEQHQPIGDGNEYSHLTQVIDESGVIETEVTYNGTRVASYKEYENTYRYQYNTGNRTATKTDSQNASWSFTYNETGQFTQIQAPLGRASVYERDEDSLLTRFVDPSGTEYLYTYDDYSNRLTESDSRGTIAMTYDSDKPWPLTVTSRSGRVTQMAYDTRGNLTTVTDSNDQDTTMVWSAQGDLLESTNPLGHKTTVTYNAQGMPLSSTDDLGRVTQYQYDALNNVTQTINPAGETSVYEYDALDRMTSYRDGNGDVTLYSYDASNRLLQVVSPLGQTIQYVYDDFGRISTRTFYDGGVYSYEYRSDNLTSQITRPDDLIISMAYDRARRLIQRAIGTASTIPPFDGEDGEGEFPIDGEFEFIELSNATIQAVSDVGSSTFNYAYNLRDQITSISNDTGTVEMAYDGFGRKQSEVVNLEATTYQYNSEDEITQLTSLGITQEQQYDVRGLMTQLDVDSVRYEYVYDVLARLSALNRNNTVDSLLQYDNANQVLAINHGTTQRGFQYSYDLAGRATQWQGVGGQTRTYNYDNLGRLTGVASPSSSESLTYDSVGNRQNNNAQFDAANQITEDNDFTYNYDQLGNRSEKINKTTGEIERYTYNGLNQLVQYQRYANDDDATLPNVDYAYTYGPLGRRWSKQNVLTDETTNFYWSGSELIGENNNGVSRRYVLEGITPTGFVENSVSYHYLKDHAGTAHEIIDDTGSLQWQGDYDSFGMVTETVNTVENNLRFSGQYFDEESQLHYNYFRDYDPALGRYIQNDPLGVTGGINTYTYVGNNPIMYTDPQGLIVCGGVCIGGIVVGGIAIANWTRNYWNEPVADISDVNGWTELTPDESIYHRMGEGNEDNRKFVSPDGRSEAVFDACDNLVTDPANAGTYNYFGPRYGNGIPHGITDVVPYMIFGSSPADMFNPQRFTTTYDHLTQ